MVLIGLPTQPPPLLLGGLGRIRRDRGAVGSPRTSGLRVSPTSRESFERVQAGPNPGLRLVGYLITMISVRRAVHNSTRRATPALRRRGSLP